MSTREQIEIARGLTSERLIELFALYTKGDIICSDAIEAAGIIAVLKNEMMRRMEG